MAYLCCFGLRGNLDVPDILQNKFYSIIEYYLSDITNGRITFQVLKRNYYFDFREKNVIFGGERKILLIYKSFIPASLSFIFAHSKQLCGTNEWRLQWNSNLDRQSRSASTLTTAERRKGYLFRMVVGSHLAQQQMYLNKLELVHLCVYVCVGWCFYT